MLKLKNIILLFLCMVRYVFRGRSNRVVAPPKKVLVVQLAKLGDMVCTTPMFRAIKKRYPNAKVYVVGDRVNCELLKHNPDVDGYLMSARNFFQVMRLVHQIRKERFDFACVTGPGPEALSLVYLSGIPMITVPVITNGFSPQETRVYRFIRKFVQSAPHAMGHYAPREYLRLLESIDIVSSDTTKHLAFSREAKNTIARFFLEQKLDPQKDFLVGLFPTTGFLRIKHWPAEKFAAVADYLSERHNAVVLISGSEEDRKECERVLEKISSSTRIVNAIGRFTIDELKACIAELRLFVSVDTGPLYIAEALSVPTIDIVGAVDDREQPPVGRLHKIVKVPRSEAQLHIMNARMYDQKEAKRQIDEISIGMVCQAIDDLVPLIKKDGECHV